MESEALLRAFDSLFTVFQHGLQSPRFDGGKCSAEEVPSQVRIRSSRVAHHLYYAEPVVGFSGLFAKRIRYKECVF